MSKKEKHILNIKFMYEYYEDDITERYMGNLSTNVILDNDCFDIEPLEKIYVTPFKKYHQLAKENEEIKLKLLEKKCSDKDVEYKEKIKLQNRINKAIEYIENNSLYETEYDYDYEENSYLSGIDDEIAKKDLLKILKGEE